MEVLYRWILARMKERLEKKIDPKSFDVGLSRRLDALTVLLKD